jgi:hypothetical protein
MLLAYGWVNCPGCGAALALQTGLTGCLDLSSAAADLQTVISAWDSVPDLIRKAILTLVGFRPADVGNEGWDVDRN